MFSVFSLRGLAIFIKPMCCGAASVALLGLTGPVAQAACCIKSQNLTVRQYAEAFGQAHIDDSAGWGHAFDIDVELEYREDLQGESCSLQWWEWTDYVVPGLQGSGMQEGYWYDHKLTNPISPMWEDWENALERLSPEQPQVRVRITDYPALGLSSVEVRRPQSGSLDIWYRPSKSRTLKIQAVLLSGSHQCPVQEESVALTQVLSVRSGNPDQGSLVVHQWPFFSPYQLALMSGPVERP